METIIGINTGIFQWTDGSLANKKIRRFKIPGKYRAEDVHNSSEKEGDDGF